MKKPSSNVNDRQTEANIRQRLPSDYSKGRSQYDAYNEKPDVREGKIEQNRVEKPGK
jgi:hypothetical protein